MKPTSRLVVLVSLLALGLALTSPSADAVEGPSACPTWRQATYTVGTTPVALQGTAGTVLPAPGSGRLNSLGQLAGRRYLTVCQSKATTSTTALVTVRVDGFAFGSYAVDAGRYGDGGAIDAGLAPNDGGPEPTAAGWGECISYPVPDSVIPRATSTEAGAVVTVFECGGTP